MGVDFGLHAVEPISNNKFRFVEGDLFHFSQRLHFLWDIFRSDLNGKIQALLPKKVSFEWFDKAYVDSKEEPTFDHCWPPELVLDCIETVYNTIQIHDNEFPPHYLLKRKDKKYWPMEGSLHIFYNDCPYHISCDWNSCIAKPDKREINYDWTDVDEIDLAQLTEFQCFESNNVKTEDGKWVKVKGPEVTWLIIKQSFFNVHKWNLENMMSVCQYAAKGGYLIHSEYG